MLYVNPFQRVKFVTKEFQARVAQLALGRQSHPSSAPCDTRLFTRPLSGTANRSTVPAQTDLKNRPQTAPSGSQPSLAGSNISDAEIRPDMYEAAFMASMHDLSKTMPVMSDRAQKQMQKSLVRESTELFLPNAMESEGIETKNGAVRQKPAKQPPPPGYPRTPYMKPPARIAREKTFLKPMKSPRDVVKARPIHKPKALDSVEEYTESDDNVPVLAGPSKHHESKEIKNQKQKEIRTKQVKIVAQPAGDKSAEVDADSTKVRNKDIRTIGFKKQEPKGVLKRNESLSKTVQKPVEVGIKQDRNQSKNDRNNSGSGKNKERGPSGGQERASTKDVAYSVLQKLTVKREPDAHKPGQVPSVNRKPVKKYKFDTPQQGPEGEGNMYRDEENKADSGKFVGIRPGDVRRVGSVRRVDKVQREQTERKTKDLSDVYEQGSHKPVSAPVRGSLRQSRDLGEKEWNRDTRVEHKKPIGKSQSADIHAREKQKSASEEKTSIGKTDTSVGTKATIKIVVSDDGAKGSLKEDKSNSMKSRDSKQDGKHVPSAGSHGNRRPDNRSAQQKSSAGKTRTEDMPQVVRSDKTSVASASGKGRSVKLQNAMISTSHEVSNSKILHDTEGDGESVRASSAASSVHPKLQDSPYLKDNPLLQSGKQRRRPGAGSAQGPTRGTEQN